MPMAAVNGVRIYYEIHGEGEPLTLLLGLGSDISEWGAIIDWLAQSYLVVALDNRGAGRSDKPDQPYSVEMMAEDTSSVLEATGVERSHVVGISLGGRIALALALAHPERVRKLVLVSTSARTAKRPLWFGPVSLLSSLPLLRSKYPQPRYAFRRQLQASSSFNCSNRLNEVHAPTLILQGEHDGIVPRVLTEELRAGIAGSLLEWFEGGHIFMIGRQRQRFLDTVSAFLSGDLGNSRPAR